MTTTPHFTNKETEAQRNSVSNDPQPEQQGPSASDATWLGPFITPCSPTPITNEESPTAMTTPPRVIGVRPHGAGHSLGPMLGALQECTHFIPSTAQIWEPGGFRDGDGAGDVAQVVECWPSKCNPREGVRLRERKRERERDEEYRLSGAPGLPANHCRAVVGPPASNFSVSCNPLSNYKHVWVRIHGIGLTGCPPRAGIRCQSLGGRLGLAARVGQGRGGGCWCF
jgi:hypothetical protein